MLALVDCNNFFVSCERVFNPKLENIPVVVLSNNDGCIISRSNEAKALGIPMGIPYFKAAPLIKQHGIKVLSSNYALYGDMSQRVMSILRDACPDMEVYSIDEAFLDLASFQHQDLIAYGTALRAKVKQWTGMPITIGIAATKTLAKIANGAAKKQKCVDVLMLRSVAEQELMLKITPVEEIWGVGRKLAPKLQKLGIYNAYDLSCYNPKLLRQHFNVVLEKMSYELRGTSCLPLEDVMPRKNIQSSRSFGVAVTDLEHLKEAISTYTANACEKLRQQQSVTQLVGVYLRTNRYKSDDEYYSNSQIIGLEQPTDDTRIIVRTTVKLMEALYQKGYAYQKCGVLLLDIRPNTICQSDLLALNSYAPSKLMLTLDNINRRFGYGTLQFAAEGIAKPWQNRRDLKSPCYTTRWDEVMRVG